MLIKHVFPSDGEYTITVTPIFGDNMSPTGFGSVPCEKIEFLLDGERLQIDGLAGRRPGVALPPAAAAARGPASGRRTGWTGPDSVPAVAARTQPFPMRVRFKTTAGSHAVGVTFPQTNFAPILDLDQHFVRDTVQTGPTPGFTYFPHVGTVRIEGPYNAAAAKDSPSRRRSSSAIRRGGG